MCKNALRDLSQPEIHRINSATAPVNTLTTQCRSLSCHLASVGARPLKNNHNGACCHTLGLLDIRRRRGRRCYGDGREIYFRFDGRKQSIWLGNVTGKVWGALFVVEKGYMARCCFTLGLCVKKIFLFRINYL